MTLPSRGTLRKFLMAFVVGCLVVRQRQTKSIFLSPEAANIIIDNQNAAIIATNTDLAAAPVQALSTIQVQQAAATQDMPRNLTTTTPPSSLSLLSNNQQPQQDSLAVVFPHFIQDYIEFHKQQRNQFATANYLIWRCPRGASCGGTGDRIKGILSAFYTAICSRRVLLIDWPLNESPDVSPFLNPHYINWRIPDQLRGSRLQMAGVYSAIDSYAHPFFQQLQIPERFLQTRIIDMRANLWSEHIKAAVQVNDTQCVQQLWQQEATKQPQPKVPFSSQNKALFRMGFWCLFTFSDTVHDRKRNMQTRTGLLEYSNKPAPEDNKNVEAKPAVAVMEKAASTNNNKDDEGDDDSFDEEKKREKERRQYAEQQQLLKSVFGRSNNRGRKLQTVPSSPSSTSLLAGQTTMQPYIAVHIRTGIGVQFKDPVRHNSMEDYQHFYSCAKKLQQAIYERQRQSRTSSCSSTFDFQYDYQRVLPPLPIYVAADNAVAKKTMVQLENQERQRQQASGTNNATTGTSSSPPPSIRILPEMQIFHIDKSQGVGNAQENTVWGELNVLLEATCLVASRSGFSDLAAWLQPAHHNGKRCAIMYSKCDDEAHVQQALDALEFPNAAC